MEVLSQVGSRGRTQIQCRRNNTPYTRKVIQCDGNIWRHKEMFMQPNFQGHSCWARVGVKKI